jgi:hypothetical protein
MIFNGHDCAFTVIGVAIWIAVREPRCDLSQIARTDLLTAQRTQRLLAGHPAIHQDESHMAPPNAKQRMESSLRNFLALKSYDSGCNCLSGSLKTE